MQSLILLGKLLDIAANKILVAANDVAISNNKMEIGEDDVSLVVPSVSHITMHHLTSP